MKLTKIGYMSAVVFGVLSLVMYLLVGVLQWSLRDVLAASGIPVDAVQTFIVAPIVGGFVGYLIVLAMIAVYNLVARRYPISWQVKK
ncbi:hypothetical protein HNV12_01025 [Methanococcoides sp. SA1]|nr:hypothetical protein [Methanococcoides sp. SA1]